MKIVGLMPVRNESWCLEVSLRTALRWCDSVVVLLHECTDESRQIVEQLAYKFEGRIIKDACYGPWREMEHRHLMLRYARENGATHIAIVDADEIVTANIIGEEGDYSRFGLRDYISELDPGEMLTMPLYNLRGSLWRYHSNGIWGNRWVSVAWKDTGKEHWTGDQFHHREPWGQQWKQVKPIAQGAGGICHLWGSSERRLKAKHAWYACVERVRWPHKPVASIAHMYGLAFENPQLWRFDDIPKEWWRHVTVTDIDIDGIPWQEAEVRRLIADHGAAKFAGLNLHGLDK